MFQRDMLRGFACSAFAVMAPVFATSAQAAFKVTVGDVGSNVVATGAGSIDLTDLMLSFTSGGAGVVNGSEAYLLIGSSGAALVYNGAVGPASFGVLNQNFDSDSDSGGYAGIIGSVDNIVVPQDYVSGATLSNQSVFDGESLATLGLTPGTYVYSWGTGDHADTLTVQIGGVPEASTWAMMLLGLGGLGLLGGRARKAGAIA